MSAKEQFNSGLHFIFNRYVSSIDGQPFNREVVISAVNIFTKLGFTKLRNRGNMVIMELVKYNSSYIIEIGRLGDESSFTYSVR